MAGCWCFTVCLTPHRPVRGRIPGGSGSSAAVMSAAAPTRYPGDRRWRLDDNDHPAFALPEPSSLGNAVDGVEGSAPAGVYPPLPCRSPPITEGIYRGRGPLYPAEPGRAPTSGNR